MERRIERRRVIVADMMPERRIGKASPPQEIMREEHLKERIRKREAEKKQSHEGTSLSFGEVIFQAPK